MEHAVKERVQHSGDMSRPYLQLQQVCKEFGKFTALDNINLDIDSGEFVVFLGPSGCGKTTLLRLIAGLETLTSGAIVQNGKDVSNFPPVHRDYGIVFQSYALFPNLTIEENVGYGLVNAGMARNQRQERVAELLQMVGLPDSSQKYPNQLSGGQQQRVALARALARSPSLLLLDEPLSALDASVRVYLRNEIKMLQRRLGITTIMVTHDQEEALSMADKIVVMDNGYIRQVGTPYEIYREPQSKFVAEFVGNANVFMADVDEEGHIRVSDQAFSFNLGGSNLQAGRCALAFRPEDVSLHELKDAPSDAFQRCRVESLEFFGPFVRVSLSPAGQSPQRLLYANISDRKLNTLNIKPGCEVSVSIDTDKVIVLSDD